ncbi:hypothetical protein BAE44_0009438 [Dichanthelium oligosanthes]|uniref:Uncharacterized protein n=1 Tax=Dichanthelium oligosanthes TaxID=888268 RepID=A0A1E5VWN9_9POAL|nr:hypothetical protein BAE44_0009438 [Dichanthelium oligosanthes]
MIFMMESPVSVHGNLQWLVLSETTGKVTLIVFDTAHEEFRLMVAPERPGLRLETARTAVLSSGKLCVLALRKAPPSSADTPDTVEMWVLDDYHGADPLTWRRLRGNIRMVPMDGARAGLSRFTLATAVEAEGAEEGQEILFRWQERIDAYNVRGDVWRSVSVAKDAFLVIHRASVLLPETSFGEAVRLLPREEDIFGQRPYCL